MDLRGKLYPEYARLAQALASERRLELIELLAQAPRSVDSLAGLTGMSVANVSQHLQVLRRARLVTAEARGVSRLYRLADDRVLELWLAVQEAAREQLAEVAARLAARDVETPPPVDRDQLERRIRDREIIAIDVRPRLEFDHGHVAGALSIPLEELPVRMGEIIDGLPVVAYCRGLACLLADEAVQLLRSHGFEAYRLDGGWPEWRVEGRPVESFQPSAADLSA